MNQNVFVILLIACGLLFKIQISYAQESTVDTSKVRVLRIDPATANGGSMSQVFEEIDFIPLQSTKESMFGDIKQLETTENFYIIFDDDTKCILIFDKNGIFKNKINMGKIIGGKIDPQDIDVHSFKLVDSKLIEFSTSNKAYKFDTEGKQIGEPIDIKREHISNETYFFKDSTYIESYFKVNSNFLYQYVYLKQGKIKSKYFKLETGKNSSEGDFAVGGPSFIQTTENGKLYGVRNYDYNIYQLDNNGISIAFRLIFPSKNTLPKDFNTNKIYKGKRLQYFFKNAENIFGIGYTYGIGDYLYFKCGSLSSNIRKNGSFVYDLKNDYLISLNRLDPDSLSHNLPIIGTWDNDFKKFDGNYLYASLSSLELFSFYEQVKKKNPQYPIAMQNYFKKGSKKDNPVLIRLKPKRVS